MTDATETPLERLLRAVAEAVLSYPRAILVAYLACVACVAGVVVPANQTSDKTAQNENERGQ